MSSEDLLQYAITTAEENRLLRMTSLTQNIPSRAKLREREKMGGAKTGEEARAAILAKRAAAQAAEKQKKRKEASRKREREQNEMRKKEMKRRRKEEKEKRETEKEEKRREKEEKALLKSRAIVKREADRKVRVQAKGGAKGTSSGTKTPHRSTGKRKAGRMSDMQKTRQSRNRVRQVYCL